MQERHKKLLAVLLVFTLLMSVFAAPAGAAAVSEAATGNDVTEISINSISPVTIISEGGGSEFMFRAYDTETVQIFADDLVSDDADGIVITLLDEEKNVLNEVYDTQKPYMEYAVEEGNAYYIQTRINDGFASGNYNLYLFDTDHLFDSIEPNETKVVTTATSDESYYLKYTPEKNVKVRFFSSNENDTLGYLYAVDEYGYLIELERDDDSGSGSNFNFIYELNADETYFFRARFYSSHNCGDITVFLEELPSPDDMPEVFTDQSNTFELSKNGGRYVKVKPENDFYGKVSILNKKHVPNFSFKLFAYDVDMEPIYVGNTGSSYSGEYQDHFEFYPLSLSAGGTYYFCIEADMRNYYSDASVTLTILFEEYEKLESIENAEAITLNEEKTVTFEKDDDSYKLFAYNADNYGDIYMYVKDFSESVSEPKAEIKVFEDNLYIKNNFTDISESDVCNTYFESGRTYYFAVRPISAEQGGSFTFSISDRYTNPLLAYIQNTAEEIHIGDTKPAAITDTQNTAYFKFTPEEDTEIVYFSTHNTGLDPYGHIYDEYGESINSDDDNGDGNNFRMTQQVYAGSTYYFGARLFAYEGTGTYDVHLIEVPKPHTTDGFTYLPNYDDTATLQAYEGEATEVVIPDKIDGYRITAIDDHALEGNETVKSIVVGNNVQTIGAYAFAVCPELESLVISASVTDINNTIVRSCPKLQSITVDPDNQVYDSRDKCNAIVNTFEGTIVIGCGSTTFADGVWAIGNYAFYGCTALTDLVLPDSIRDLGYGSFANCSNITSITFGKDMRSIPPFAFGSCTSLESVDIPEYIFGVDSRAFQNCTSLATVTLHGQSYVAPNAFENTPWYEGLPDGVIYSGTKAIGYKGELPEVITFKDGTTMIGNNFVNKMYTNTENVTKVIIPDTVTNIGSSSFYGCNNLTELVMSQNIEMVGSYCFSGSPWLESQPDGVLYFGNVAYRFIDSDCHPSSADEIEPYEEKKITVKDGTTAIAASFAVNNYNIVEVELPDSIESIGEYAFNHCVNLTAVNTPENLEEVGAYAFAYCYKLQNPVISGKMKGIMPYSFTRCTSFKEVEIPDGVTTISDNAFEDCYDLTTLTLPGSLDYIGNKAFKGCSLQKLECPENLGYIDDFAFWDNYYLASVKFNDSIRTIGDYAFAGNRLTCAVLPRSLERIGTRAFGYYFYGYNYEPYEEDFEKVWGFHSIIGYFGTQAERYASDNEFTFVDMDWIQGAEAIAVGTPKDVKAYPGENKWFKLTPTVSEPVYLSASVKDDPDYDYYAYYNIYDSEFQSPEMQGYWNGTAYLIEAGKTYYVETMLQGEKNEERVISLAVGHVICGDYHHISYRPPTTSIVKYIGAGGNVVIPQTLDDLTVTTITYGSFRDCSNLLSVTMPDSLISIGASAFRNCENLGSVTLNEGLEQISVDAFVTCPKLKGVTVPPSVNYISSWALGYIMTGPRQYELVPDFTIYGYTGTSAEQYAFRNNINFVSLGVIATTTDDDTGITIQSAYEDVTVKAAKVSDKQTIDTAKIALGDGNEIYEMFDISLQQDGEVVQPGGYVKVRIPSDNPNAKIYYIDDYDDDYYEATDMNAVYNNGYYEFFVDHFSLYAVVAPTGIEEEQTEESFILGDVDGNDRSDVVDATIIQRYATNITVSIDTETMELHGDVDSNNRTDVVDATFIQRYATGLTVTLPIGERVTKPKTT